MKRFLCVILAAVLFPLLCASASAGAYTHPAAGFHLTVPEGWLAIDSANVEEIIHSGRVSADMAATLTAIRGIMDSQLCVYLFKEDVAAPPFANVSVVYKGEQEEEITLADLRATAQAYESHYLENQEQLPGYTVATPAGSDQPEGWYPMGYLGGVYEQSGYRISLSQVFVAAGARLYEFTLTAEEGKASDAGADFSNLVGSFVAPDIGVEADGAQADAAVLDRGMELIEEQAGGQANFNGAIADSEAEVFTHPAGVYAFAIPDGWIAIDGALAEGLLAMGLDVVKHSNFGYADLSGEERPDGAVIMLFETERSDGLFRNNINISVTDLGQDFSTDAILSRGDGFVEYMQSVYDGFITTAPIAKKSFGELEAIVLSGEFTQGGQKRAIRQAIFSDKGILYTITLFARGDQMTECEPVFAKVITSMQQGKDNRVPILAVGVAEDAKTDVAAILDRGIELIEAQDYAGALAHFDAAIAESGDAAEIHFYRGQAFSQLYRNEEAEQALAKALELEPENARYLDEYGASLINNGKYQDAYEAIDKAVKLEPLNGEYIGDRGLVLYLLNRPGEALPELERAIELAPDYANAYYFAAIIQQGLGAFQEAARHCEAYLERVPIADEMWLMLGDARMELGSYGEALAAYDRAIANGYFAAEDIANYALAKEKAGKEEAPEVTGLPELPSPQEDSGDSQVPGVDDSDETVTVTIGASLVGWISKEDAQAQAESRGIYFAVNRDGSFSYTMTPDQQTSLWANWMKDVAEMVLQLLTTPSGVRNCEMSADFCEITFYVEPGIERDWLDTVPALFGLQMAMGRALLGEESPSTLVRIADADTGTVNHTFHVPNGR